MRSTKRFYVYALLDPTKERNVPFREFVFECEPFYIGKGCGKRMYSHASENRLTHKNRRIAKIKAAGLTPIPIKLRDEMTEEEAFCLEREAIEAIGRRCDGRGPLTNLTLGGDGLSGHRHSEATRAKLRGPKSEATRAKMIAARQGRPPVDEATRAKISASLRGRKLPLDVVERFRGRKAWNVGIPLSEEQRRHLSKINMGKPAPNKGVPMCAEKYEKCRPTMFAKGQEPWNKGLPGKPLTDEQKAARRAFRHSDEAKRRIGEASRGKPRSEEVKAKIRATKAAKRAALIGTRT